MQNLKANISVWKLQETSGMWTFVLGSVYVHVFCVCVHVRAFENNISLLVVSIWALFTV